MPAEPSHHSAQEGLWRSVTLALIHLESTRRKKFIKPRQVAQDILQASCLASLIRPFAVSRPELSFRATGTSLTHARLGSSKNSPPPLLDAFTAAAITLA